MAEGKRVSLPFWHVCVFPHFLRTTFVPWQRSPPYCGFGLTQSLVLVCKPSIDLVQKLHSLHWLQPPLTLMDKTKDNKIYRFFCFQLLESIMKIIILPSSGNYMWLKNRIRNYTLCKRFLTTLTFETFTAWDNRKHLNWTNWQATHCLQN